MPCFLFGNQRIIVELNLSAVNFASDRKTDVERMGEFGIVRQSFVHREVETGRTAVCAVILEIVRSAEFQFVAAAADPRLERTVRVATSRQRDLHDDIGSIRAGDARFAVVEVDEDAGAGYFRFGAVQDKVQRGFF